MSRSKGLLQDPDALSALCGQASAWYLAQGKSVLPAVLLKDFWVTEALRRMAKPYVDIARADGQADVTVRPVVKGGTSLSKGLHLIDRFSEDIDICLEVLPAEADLTKPELTEAVCSDNRADKIMRDLAERVAASLNVPADMPEGADKRGTRGVKRKWFLKYPVPRSHQKGRLKDGIELELVRMGKPTPAQTRDLRSLLAEWAIATQDASLVEPEMAGFSMAVLSPERTLVDKLCIVHRLALERQAQQRPLSWQVRHYYDVGRLLGDLNMVRTLQAGDRVVERYAADALQSTAKHRGKNAHPRPEGGFATSPAFTDAAHLKVVAGDYQAELTALVMGPLLPLPDVLSLVQKHAALL